MRLRNPHLVPDDRKEGAVGGRGGRADACFCHGFEGMEEPKRVVKKFAKKKKSKEEEPRAGPGASEGFEKRLVCACLVGKKEADGTSEESQPASQLRVPFSFCSRWKRTKCF